MLQPLLCCGRMPDQLLNESAMILSAFEKRLSRLSLTYHANKSSCWAE